VVPDDGVEDSEELSHHSGERELPGIPSVEQALKVEIEA